MTNDLLAPYCKQVARDQFTKTKKRIKTYSINANPVPSRMSQRTPPNDRDRFTPMEPELTIGIGRDHVHVVLGLIKVSEITSQKPIDSSSELNQPTRKKETSYARNDESFSRLLNQSLRFRQYLGDLWPRYAPNQHSKKKPQSRSLTSFPNFLNPL